MNSPVVGPVVPIELPRQDEDDLAYLIRMARAVGVEQVLMMPDADGPSDIHFDNGPAYRLRSDFDVPRIAALALKRAGLPLGRTSDVRIFDWVEGVNIVHALVWNMASGVQVGLRFDGVPPFPYINDPAPHIATHDDCAGKAENGTWPPRQLPEGRHPGFSVPRKYWEKAEPPKRPSILAMIKRWVRPLLG